MAQSERSKRSYGARPFASVHAALEPAATSLAC
jgi:hypothetical protein